MDRWHKQTFNVTLEELGQDAIGGKLVKHAAEELFGYPCNIPWDQHTAKKHKKNDNAGQAVAFHACAGYVSVSALGSHTSRLDRRNWH